MSAFPLEACGLPGPRLVHVIGAGGKTTLLYALAHALQAAGTPVVTTTTTKILPPGPGDSPATVLAERTPDVAAALRAALAAHGHVTLARAPIAAEGKLGGLGLPALETLADLLPDATFLVEADGAARKNLQAHGTHEPVVSPRADLVIAVLAVGAVGAPLDDAHVHRVTLAAQRLELPKGTILTAEHVAALALHPLGGIARLPKAVSLTVLLRGPDGPEARALLAALRAHPEAARIARFVIGQPQEAQFVLPGDAA